eukprot:3941952-Rhodomonas_salina.8
MERGRREPERGREREREKRQRQRERETETETDMRHRTKKPDLRLPDHKQSANTHTFRASNYKPRTARNQSQKKKKQKHNPGTRCTAKAVEST